MKVSEDLEFRFRSRPEWLKKRKVFFKGEKFFFKFFKFRKLLSFPPILFHRWKLSQQYLVVILGNLNFVQTSKTVEFFTNFFTGGYIPNNG